MKFSTRTTYGLRAMTSLARNYRKGSLSLATIAKNENISLSYLERIFAKLKKTDLIIAEKGAQGGYTLADDPRKITTLDIVDSRDGEVSPFRCIKEGGEIDCGASKFCEVPKVLVKVQTAVVKTLKNINLSDLI
jgi:Rrf2 family protein